MSDHVFPLTIELIKDGHGLTKRELFAGFAMMNLQNVFRRQSGAARMLIIMSECGYETAEEAIAAMAVVQADELIKALEK